MTIKVVTDSTADIPVQLREELGISVVPLYVRFGDKTFQDGVTITNDEFYARLVNGNVFPKTIQASPEDFRPVYEKLGKEADGIVSIHISEKFSGTGNSARLARGNIKNGCPVEVINSDSMSIGLGMIVLAAARAAKAGESMTSVINIANEAITRTHLLVLFDSLKYLAKGGRIGQAKSLLGTLLNIKPLLSMKDGIVVPVSQARSYSKGVEQLYTFLTGALKEKDNVKDLAIMYNTDSKEAEELADRIAALYPREKIIMGKVGPILSSHAGPNLLVTCFRGNKQPKK